MSQETTVSGHGFPQGVRKGDKRAGAFEGFHPSVGKASARATMGVGKLKVIFLHCQK